MDNCLGAVYKIYSKDKNDKNFYIGSTTNLKRRIQNHIKACNYNQDRPVYNYIRDNGGINNFIIEPIIRSNLDNEKLRDIEEYFYRTLKPTLNGNHPKRDRQTYRLENKEKISNQMKKYYADNCDKIKKHSYTEVVCPYCGRRSTKGHIRRHQKTKYCLQHQSLKDETIKVL